MRTWVKVGIGWTIFMLGLWLFFGAVGSIEFLVQTIGVGWGVIWMVSKLIKKLPTYNG